MFTFVVPNINKDIVQDFQFRSSFQIHSILIFVLDGTKQIKQDGVVIFVIFAGNVRNWEFLEHFFMIRQVAIVGIEGMILNQSQKMVCGGFRKNVDDNDVLVIPNGHGLREGPINNTGVSSETLHNQQMMRFIIGFCACIPKWNRSARQRFCASA